MKLEEYLGTLPPGIMSGQDVRMTDSTIRDALDLLGVGHKDTFYHLGCGDGRAVNEALSRGAARAVGIDSDPAVIQNAKVRCGPGAKFVCCDVTESNLDDATAILFWFADEDIISRMMPRFCRLYEGCRILTIWGPLPGCMPDKVDFPYVLNRVPLRKAQNLRDQLLAVFGVECVDFATAWEHAERYTRALQPPDAQNNRLVTIIQTLVIWINAKNMGAACGDGVPESIRTYIGILENFYGIEVGHLIEQP